MWRHCHLLVNFVPYANIVALVIYYHVQIKLVSFYLKLQLLSLIVPKQIKQQPKLFSPFES